MSGSRHFRPLLVLIGIGALVIAGWWGAPTQCVRLPHGLNLGLAAVFRLDEEGVYPPFTVKHPSGALLVDADIWPFFTTRTTVYGVSLHGEGHERFAWRRDAGVVWKKDDPAQYARLVAEAGPLLDGHDADAVGPGIVMFALQKDPAYAGQRCRTKWVLW